MRKPSFKLVSPNKRNLTKQRFATIVAVLLLASSALVMTIPIATAHTPAWNVPTYAYVTVSPNTVGIGQQAQIVMWLDKYPPTAGGLGGDRWRGFKVDVTKPDGTKVTIPYTSETSPVASAWMSYTPDQAGSYSIVFSWPGQTLTNGTGIPDMVGISFVGDYFQPATSAPAILTVTQAPTAQWQEPQLPTGYWDRPINDANRGWSTLASNWLGGSWLTGNVQNAGQAPNSPHILWTKPIVSGGIADAQWSGQLYDTDDYENPWSTPIVMNGMIFYNTGIYPKYGYYCLDLRTGQQIWYKNGTDNGLSNTVVVSMIGGGGASGPATTQTFPLLSFGQLYHYYSLNGQGVLSYLWITQGSNWYMLDSNTGNWILTLKRVPGGTAVVDQDGSLLRYSYTARTGNLLCWNSSQSIPPAGPTGTAQQQWKPMVGATIDALNDTIWTQYGPSGPVTDVSPWYASDIVPRSGYTMNVTTQTNLPGSISRVLQDDNRVPRIVFGTYFGTYAGLQGGSDITSFSAWAVRIDYNVAPYSPYANETYTQNNNLGYGATLLWYKNITIPKGGNLTWSLGAASYDDGVFTVQAKELMQRWGYSLTDGSQLWGPTQPQGAWDMYGMSNTVAYGTLYSTGYGGVLYAYNMSTGKLIWTYTAPNIGFESPYGNYPLTISAIADGKVYLHSTEHSPTIPLWRGSYLRCVDAKSGQELWKLLDFNMGLAVADGCIVTGNKYDNQMYVVGRGQSATTVSATPGLGNAITIQGSVTDQSPGQTCLGIPAAGTPAIADQFMQQWMEYLYEQQSKPANATGVPVTLYETDPNGNTYKIATVTTDISGHYVISWTPTLQGAYTIAAAFDGTNSYYSSTAETGIAVGAPQASAAPVNTPTPKPTAPPVVVTPTAPAQTVAPTPTPVVIPPPQSATPTATYIAVGGAIIVIVAIAAALMLRRRK